MTIPHDLFDKFRKKYDEILEPVLQDLLAKGFTPKDIEKNIDAFINTTFKTHKVEKAISNVTVELSINAVVLGGTSLATNEIKNLSQDLLKNNWFSDDLNLSQRLHRNVNRLKTGISSIIKDTLGQSVNWQKTAQGIFKLKDLEVELPKYMKRLIKQGNKVLVDPSLIRQFQKETKAARKQISRLVNLGLENPRLKKAYNNIIKQIEKGSYEGLEKAIKRAVLAKTKYHAEVIARTEISAAYGNSVAYQAQEDKNTVAIESDLSSRHNILDVCDVHAKVNQYGLGQGVFPVNRLPPFPYHPNCMCILRPLTANQVRKSKKVNRKTQIDKFTILKPGLLNKKGELPLLRNDFFKPKKPTFDE